MRLVDADELIERAYRERLDSRELIAQMIETAKTIDAVPVVRCKDCKKWLTPLPRKEAEYGFCMTGDTLVVRKKDFFCADGDRREIDG